VVTSIAAPNDALRSLAAGSLEHGFDFIVIGDVPSPTDFDIDGCRFYGLDAQRELGFRFADACPTRHYARKNIGYLLAIREAATKIVETDDDNHPRPSFWVERERLQHVPVASAGGWVNAYRWFSDAPIWPRGLPLDRIHDRVQPIDDLASSQVECPIQQGLADENPDVDAVYRLTMPLPQSFRGDRRVALLPGTWSPFNSQNTTWFPDAYPLLYLPAHCSFRMTDIWRSFVAQRVGWANGWSVLFHEPTVVQERNDHDLMRDFADEVPGYLHNDAIRTALDALDLEPGIDALGGNLRRCYEELVAMGVVGEAELPLLDAWLADLADITPT
jgi:hypothetical protein